MDKKTVLIVEDDPFLSDMYSTKFTTSGYEVELAQDGKQCLDMLTEGLRPAIVLLDVVLPKMDGIELLSTLKSNEELKFIPVVLLTNLGQESDMARGLEAGAADYLVKAHFTPSEVVKKVEEVLHKVESTK